MNGCRGQYRDGLAIAWPVANGAAVKGCPAHGSDGSYRSDQLHKIGDVVRAKIKDWTATRAEEEIRVWMPMFHAVRHDMAGATTDGANIAIINAGTRLLMAAAEKGIGGRSNP